MEKRILLIDDDHLVRKSFQHLLTMHGYDVKSAPSFDKAVQYIESFDFNLILSDIRMPEKNGVETVVALQAKLADIGKDCLPVIFMTGFAEDADELDAMSHGMVLYKPIDSSQLLDTVRDSVL